ncbi:MAG TPA: class I SAM-dependent methyltransferase [Thermoanaerobaculia bacterium]|nr:class I SAM-dependent methyltransferase [Thermoanaerobaculia bacterium]
MSAAPDSTAVRVALWRALHVLIDPPPHVLEDTIGLQLVAPDASWRERGDMHPEGTKLMRISIVTRARFVEDLVLHERPPQYVILGAGLDTFVQRHRDLPIKVFEVDRSEPQEWKRQRLTALGLPLPVFVGVDFEKESWWERLIDAGFDSKQRALVASTGVSMYLTKEANAETLGHIATLPAGSTFVMSFLLPIDLIDASERPMMEMSINGARRSGTPFVSFFSPEEMVAMAREAGFKEASVKKISSTSEQLLVART